MINDSARQNRRDFKITRLAKSRKCRNRFTWWADSLAFSRTSHSSSCPSLSTYFFLFFFLFFETRRFAEFTVPFPTAKIQVSINFRRKWYFHSAKWSRNIVWPTIHILERIVKVISHGAFVGILRRWCTIVRVTRVPRASWIRPAPSETVARAQLSNVRRTQLRQDRRSLRNARANYVRRPRIMISGAVMPHLGQRLTGKVRTDNESNSAGSTPDCEMSLSPFGKDPLKSISLLSPPLHVPSVSTS